MGGRWTESDTLTMWISARSWCGVYVERSWNWHTWPPNYRCNTAENNRLGYQHNYFLSLRRINTGWPSHRRPRPSTDWLRDAQVWRLAKPTSSCMICTVTCRKLLWSSTKYLAPTLGKTSATFLYPRSKFWQDTSAPQCERGGQSESTAIYPPLPPR